MKTLLSVMAAFTITHVQGAVWTIVDTDNKVICYALAAEKGLYGAEQISCVHLDTVPVVPPEVKK